MISFQCFSIATASVVVSGLAGLAFTEEQYALVTPGAAITTLNEGWGETLVVLPPTDAELLQQALDADPATDVSMTMEELRQFMGIGE
jgi:hypothetical protein